MIPETLNLIDVDDLTEYETAPSLTYRIDFENHRIISKIDNEEAVLQFVRKVLNTTKYSYAIYDWYYGNEISSVLTLSYDYVIVELPRIIEEALLVDDRITYIDNWAFSEISGDSMHVSFHVHTIYGEIIYEQEVSL